MEYDPDLELMVVRTGETSYTILFYDPVTHLLAVDIPDGIPVTVWSSDSTTSSPGSDAVNGVTKNGVATITLASNKIMKYININAEGIHDFILWDTPVNPVTSWNSDSTSGGGSGRGVTAPQTVYNTQQKVIKVTFGEPVKAGSYWIELKDSKGKAITTTKSISGDVLTLKPGTALTKGAKYTLILHTGSVTDSMGDDMPLFTIKFTTDFTSPAVKTVDPVNKAVMYLQQKQLR